MLVFEVAVHVAAEEVVVDFLHPKFARLDTEGKQLLSEYAKAFPKIMDFYENIRIDSTVTTIDNLSEKSLRTLKIIGESQSLNEIEFQDLVERATRSEKQYATRHRLADKYSRIDGIVNHPVLPSMRSKLPPELSQRDFIQETEITLFTPTMGYQFSKNDPRNQYYSLNVRRDISNPNGKGIAVTVMYFDVAPFGSEGMSFWDTLFQCPPLIEGKPYQVVEYVRQKVIGGEQIVEIRLVSSRHLDSNPEDIRGEIRLCRDTWVVRETYAKTLGITSGNIGWIRTLCTYDEVFDGVPLLKTYQRSSGDYDKETQEEKLTRQMFCEVTKIIPGPPDLSEFDVAQFLPPDVNIGEITPITFARLTTGRIVGIVIGVVLIILGIYLKIRDARKR